MPSPKALTPTKPRAVHLLRHQGETWKEISSIFGKQKSWACRIFQKYEAEGFPLNERRCPGPLRKISSNLTPIVKQLVMTKKFRSYTHKDVANCLRETGFADDLIAAYILPYIEENKSAIFQQDGASIHTSKLNRKFLDRFGISPPFWPPKSPDLSVIENVWGSIKFELAKNTSIKTVQDIARAVSELWNKLVTRKFCEALWESIPDRIAAVIANKGARMKY
ncbi:hypothetical protein BV898_17864 [Hypsibius exemplaris]|uniref:Tc1-like transposase DDE domain-containing protein n=1 Tax=Hypsibius exemplaris TaxID=2072580 RepID=A0A9X6RMV9_HYPEX|nr:hypothetical protein BV898_17864 [Hypsibius exemplaris]